MEWNQIKNLRDLLDHAADSWQDKTFLRYKEGKDISEMSYNSMRKAALSFAQALDGMGQAGKHVAVIGPTSWQWVAAYMGAACSGGVAVPVDSQLPPEDFFDLLNRADVETLVFDGVFLEAAKGAMKACPNIKHFVHMQAEEDGEGYTSFKKHLAENTGDYTRKLEKSQLAAILYTSGTTGKSKGVMLTHGNLVDNVILEDLGVDGLKTVSLTVLPIHHAYCFTCDILMAFLIGVTVCVNDSIMHLSRNLQVFKPTIMLLVPMIAQSMFYKVSEAVKANPGVPPAMVAKQAFGGALETIYSGGAYLDPAMVDGFRGLGIEVQQGYGMTESAPRISTNDKGSTKIGSVGKPMPECQVRIVEGELWVKSPCVMVGYYKNPEATAETIVEDGWLRTGDLVHQDEEGYLYITGRCKNLIILSNGENISPEELENYLYAIPLIKEALVYGEKDQIIAELFLNEDIIQAMGVENPKDVVSQKVEEINNKLPLTKRFASVRFRDIEFDKTTSKKIKRTQVHLGK